jgi:ribosomal protein L29
MKERNALHAEKLAYRAAKQAMPSPGRLTSTRRSMARIKGVMAERLQEHQDPAVRTQLKAFIDAM